MRFLLAGFRKCSAEKNHSAALWGPNQKPLPPHPSLSDGSLYVLMYFVPFFIPIGLLLDQQHKTHTSIRVITSVIINYLYFCQPSLSFLFYLQCWAVSQAWIAFHQSSTISFFIFFKVTLDSKFVLVIMSMGLDLMSHLDKPVRATVDMMAELTCPVPMQDADVLQDGFISDPWGCIWSCPGTLVSACSL